MNREHFVNIYIVYIDISCQKMGILWRKIYLIEYIYNDTIIANNVAKSFVLRETRKKE